MSYPTMEIDWCLPLLQPPRFQVVLLLLLLFCLKLLRVTTAMRACQACPSPASALVRLLFRAFTISAPLPTTWDTEVLVSSQFSGLISLPSWNRPLQSQQIRYSLASCPRDILFPSPSRSRCSQKSAQGPQDWADLLSPIEPHFMQYFSGPSI